MLGKNQRSSRPQMGHVQQYLTVRVACCSVLHAIATVYSGKTENKRWFQASGTW